MNTMSDDNPVVMHAPQNDPIPLKFNRNYYDSVPHRFDTGYDRNGRVLSEVEIVTVEPGNEPSDAHFLSKGDTLKHYFRHDKGDDTRFATRKQQLQLHCQRDPILYDQHGNVLVGYDDWFPLIKLGIPPKTEMVYVATESEGITLIRRLTLGGHHLTERQRMAIVTAEIKAHFNRNNSWNAEELGVARGTVIKRRKYLEKLGPQNGGIPALKEVDCKDGTKQPHESVKPLTEEEMRMELEKNKREAAEREQAKNLKAIQEYLKQKDDLLLAPDNPNKTLANILQAVNETDFTNPALADGLKAVQETIAKQQSEGWKPMKVEKRKPDSAKAIHAALCQQYSSDSLQGIAHFFHDLLDAAAQGDIEADDQVEEGLITSTKAVIEEAQTLLEVFTGETPRTSSVSVVATTTWDVQTADAATTKAGLSIKLKVAQVPDKVDVVEQVKPGPVIFGGKIINFNDHGLLLLPHQTQDATLSAEPPKEDDLRNEAAK